MQSRSRPKGQHARTIGRLEFIRRHLDKSDTEVARLLGVHRSAVHQLRQKYQIAKVHSFTQLRERMVERMRHLKPGLSLRAAAQQLGVSQLTAQKYARLVGYQFLRRPAARHFYWQKRFKKLPALLSVAAVARELGLTYGYAALLCHRYRYQASLRTGKKRARVPVRNHQPRPAHERWLASLKPADFGQQA